MNTAREENLSVCDLYTIGVGPSSSHTVGPMRAGFRFAEALTIDGICDRVAAVRCELFGSLALTGKGHATDRAVLLGLSGQRPSKVDPEAIDAIVADIHARGRLKLGGIREIGFDVAGDLLFRMDVFLPEHPNGMTLPARDDPDAVLKTETYFSVGGGFIVPGGEGERATSPMGDNFRLTHPFHSGEELMAVCAENELSVADVMRANETAWRPEQETDAFLDKVHDAMIASIRRGCRQHGILPGGLEVRRRAPDLHRALTERPEASLRDPLTVMDWVNLYALAVNEENAAGGRVVTAPTNGAAGVIPAVLHYYEQFVPGADRKGVRDFLLTAAAIGTLYKKRASISAAEVGCQGEVGVACSMAAGALCAVMGGSVAQVENAAEIGMEHNLGLTCDPVGGLVQVPCIERNTMGAVKAINAARLALRGDGGHLVSLDSVIETMRQTGRDMQTKYKETSQGGLAVNVVAC